MEKASIHTEDGSKIDVMFNPAEYSEGIESTLSGAGANVQFSQVTYSDFSIELLFDTYQGKESPDVRNYTNRIRDLARPSVSKGPVKQPPVCTFVWGSFSYTGIVSKVEQVTSDPNKQTLELSDALRDPGAGGDVGEQSEEYEKTRNH